MMRFHRTIRLRGEDRTVDLATGQGTQQTPWGSIVVQRGDVLVPYGDRVVPIPERLLDELLDGAAAPPAPGAPPEPAAPPEPGRAGGPDLDAMSRQALIKLGAEEFQGRAPWVSLTTDALRARLRELFEARS